MADGGTPEPKLTPAQTRAIAALLTARDVSEAAKAADVGVRTLHRWLAEDPAFVAALDAAQQQALVATLRRLTALGTEATAVIAGIMADSSASDAVRLRAADTVLARLLQWRELVQVEERLAAIEVALAQLGGRNAHTNSAD